MQFTLVPHPASPPSDTALKLWVNVDHAGSLAAVATTNIWFGVGAPADRFVIPEPIAEPGRADDLWKATCFEAFLRPLGQQAYTEWNFAPSGQWASYNFSDYREDMVPADVAAAPYVRVEDNFTWWALGATIAIPADRNWELGLSVVLEEKGGLTSYWALAHACNKPDFHDPGCFAGRLP